MNHKNTIPLQGWNLKVDICLLIALHTLLWENFKSHWVIKYEERERISDVFKNIQHLYYKDNIKKIEAIGMRSVNIKITQQEQELHYFMREEINGNQMK